MIKCKCCDTFHHIRIETPPEEKEFRKIKSFLGQQLGEGLKKEDLNQVFVARIDGNRKIIGCLQTVILDKPVVYLTRLKIAKPFRRQALAKDLMKRALQHLFANEFTQAYAVTLLKGPEQLVKSLGAKEVRKEELLKYIPGELLEKYNNKFKFWHIPNETMP